MFLIGGHGDQRKKKDVWKLNLSCFKEPNYYWTRLSDLEVPTHRCFTFAVDSKENKNCDVFVIGGFGESFKKLKEVSGTGKTVVTHDLMKMPASERKQFLESSSLAGFGAVYDYIGERLILIGGERFKLNS
jgi:hypothetical protein